MIEKFWECPRYKYIKAYQESIQDALPGDKTIPYNPFIRCSDCNGPIIGKCDLPTCMICIDTDIVKTEKQRLKLAKQIRRGIQKRESKNKRYARRGIT